MSSYPKIMLGPGGEFGVGGCDAIEDEYLVRNADREHVVPMYLEEMEDDGWVEAHMVPRTEEEVHSLWESLDSKNRDGGTGLTMRLGEVWMHRPESDPAGVEVSLFLVGVGRHGETVSSDWARRLYAAPGGGFDSEDIATLRSGGLTASAIEALVDAGLVEDVARALSS